MTNDNCYYSLLEQIILTLAVAVVTRIDCGQTSEACGSWLLEQGFVRERDRIYAWTIAMTNIIMMYYRF